MGYTVPDLTNTRNYVIANGVALLITYAINFLSQAIVMGCYQTNSKQQSQILQRLLQTSRTLYWFSIATIFSVFPPFYFGMHSVTLGWVTLIFVTLMHIMCFVRRWDGARSIWSYCYFFFYLSVFIWIAVSLLLGYIWANQQPQAIDTNQR